MAKFPPEPTVARIRGQIFQAHESYHNDYDILAELIQNAIDAITVRFEENVVGYNGYVSISVNSDDREIAIEDNGIGMSTVQLDKVVQFYESEKKSDEKTVGEKEIGLSFALFQSNSASIVTDDGKVESVMNVSGARDWAHADDNREFDMPVVESKEKKLGHQGTKVVLKYIEDNDFFKLNVEQLKFTIRTKTAIGNTDSIWALDNNRKISVVLTYQNNKLNIHAEREPVEFKYYLLDDINNKDIVSISSFKKRFSTADSTDAQKISYLRGKYLTASGEDKINGRDIKYYAYFVPVMGAWKSRSESEGLISLNDNKKGISPEYAKFQSEITLSVKGMPTGISVSMDSLRGMSGYIPRMFMIIEDPGLRFDIGRKTVVGSTTYSYRKIAESIFQQYRTIAAKWMARDFNPRLEKEERSVKFNKLRELPVLEGDTSFLKVPMQEGTVSGIFFEQFGKGKLSSLRILQHGYNDIYDLYGQVGQQDVVLEFKQHLKDFINDAAEDVKRWNDVNYLIMFDLDNDDIEAARKAGVSIQRFEYPDDSHLSASASMGTMFDTVIYIILMADIIIRK